MSPEPRVLLDATSIPPSRGGVARFIAGVATGLHEAGRSIDVVVKERDRDFLREAAPSHRYHLAPKQVDSRGGRFVWEQTGLPRLADRLGCTVIHSPHYTFPLTTRARRVVTVHDATFFSSPEVHSRLKATFFRRWTRWACRFADELVTVSEATATELRRHVPAIRPRMSVARLGVDRTVFHPPTQDAVDEVRERLGLTGERGWIAFLGTIEPRKNVPALIRAVQALRAADPSTPPLVLSGSRGWDDEAIALLEGGADGVIEAGYLPLELLSAFLGGSLLVVYPSLGEGFGLPVLEAMASGAPVLTTRRLSIPEVGGDAVAYSEPDADSLAAAVAALLADDALRTRLAAEGFARSAAFTWLACAEIYLAAYDGTTAA
ncbi:glycosyltransferase family 4 protein [Herbiconiux sp. A18JL235]|uniref:Glycosyltransferase family 4 protein n=1 Tax=Herbiconiux sp. A18JL235 TaxID=3152363 RepID=A0AB39BJC0_9MICO